MQAKDLKQTAASIGDRVAPSPRALISMREISISFLVRSIKRWSEQRQSFMIETEEHSNGFDFGLIHFTPLLISVSRLGEFLKFQATNFLTKVVLGDIFAYSQTSIKSKKYCGYFLGNFLKILGHFLFQHLVTLLLRFVIEELKMKLFDCECHTKWCLRYAATSQATNHSLYKLFF